MAISSQYISVRHYCEDVLDFLKTYRWVYSIPNTHVLVNKVFDQFPSEWLPFLRKLSNEELNNLSLGQLPDDAPSTLIVFFQKLHQLKPTIEKKKVYEKFTFHNNSGLSKKKQHEIVSLAPLIHEICEKSGCDFIVDAGTGLGYLPRILYEKYEYRTLGIEGDSEKVKLAKLTQKKFPQSNGFITYFEHFITNESEQVLKNALKITKMNGCCITGLHACADLSITILELFIKLESARSLVIMPCCYHRLKENGEGFENFPASNLMRELFEIYEAKEFLKVPFLRLACQNSVEAFSSLSPAQHHERSCNCLFRAILQDVAESGNCQVRRIKRRSRQSTLSTCDPFENYLTNLKNTHSLLGGEITDHQFLARMLEKWTQHKGNAYLIEALAAFQAAMQSVCENVVLLDRVMFLKEQGVECFVVKVTDQGISPRCHALVALKP